MKLLLLFLLPITCFAQDSIPDSLQTYPVVKWQLWRLINETELHRMGDTLIAKQDLELQQAHKVISDDDSLLLIKDQRIVLSDSSAFLWQQRWEVKNKELGLEKKQRRKWKTIGLGVVGIEAVRLALKFFSP